MRVSEREMQFRSAVSTPVYGSFWRWLFRRPLYYLVSYEFVTGARGEVIDPQFVINGTNASNNIDNA